MDRYIYIHGHFYQPPRENPWLEAIEIQNSESLKILGERESLPEEWPVFGTTGYDFLNAANAGKAVAKRDAGSD
jgi:hypothetical protein